jgi:N-acetylgalactosamine kinase
MTLANRHPLAQWKAWLNSPKSPLVCQIADLYGGADLIEKPLSLLRQAIDEFARSYGADRSVFVVRSTGRVNMLGMHVDHRGGSVNPIAIKEAFFVVEPRDDDQVILRDINGDKFPEESFGIGDCLPKGRKIANWDTWCHEELEKRKGNPRITFSNYVRAGVLYFQHLNTDDQGRFIPAFKGMNVMIASNVPPAAGLSTSSCLVVGAGLAALHVNGLEMDPMKFCEHCGFAEWYVGTRGGFGDHAAIRMGRTNSIVHMTSFPFSLEVVPFPAGYRVVLADSLVEAKKQAGAKDGYNMPLAAYAFGLWLARKQNPALADKMGHLRDINSQTLGISEADVMRIIKRLPETVTRADILALLPEKKTDLENIFRSHNEPRDGYKVRRVCMYGISECIRSNLCLEMIKAGDIEGYGRLITLHHDGDRVTRLVKGEMVPVDKDYPDALMDRLIADLESGDPRRIAGAHLWAQPGGYNVSVPGIDMLVDLALEIPGVVGAGLVGAGLGGSMIALVKAAQAQQVVDHLADKYYKAKGLPVKAEVVAAVGGAGILAP